MIQSEHTIPFVHLRAQSAYSIGVGVSTPWEICAHASRVGFKAAAMTDIGGTWGFVEFHRAAKQFGIKPIYGVTLGLLGGREPPTRLCWVVLIAMDRQGLKNLCSLASLARDDARAEPSIQLGDLKSHSDGLVCILEPADIEPENEYGLIPGAGEGGQLKETLADLQSTFRDRVFVGFAPEDDAAHSAWLADAEELEVPSVLTQDVRYVGFKHYSLVTSDADDGESPRAGEDSDALAPVDRYRFLSLAEVSSWYPRHPDAYTNASLIASLVHPDLLDKLDEPVPASDAPHLFDAGSEGEYVRVLRETVEKRFEERFAEATDNELNRLGAILEGELDAIRDSGSAESFLRFHEIVSRLRRLHIPLGPSTGLRLQSLTAFLLGITAFDPYEIDDHFLPEFGDDTISRRILDLQIASSDRAVAVNALRQLFEGLGVGYVPSVEHVTPLRALKVAGREMDIDEREFSEVIRIAGEHPGVTLKKLCEENRDIGRLYRRSAAVRELVATSAAIEGLPIGFIRSKRTLIVSPRQLKEYIGFSVDSDTGAVFFQATRDAFPTESVFRIDFTTLTALGVCANVDRYLEPSGEALGGWARPSYAPDETAAEFAHITDGDVDGVYLLESPLTQRLATEFGVTSFDDLANFLAIMRFRRGDLSFVGRVEAFKKGPPSADRIDPNISFLLNDTNGWVLYDDQLREIVSVLTALPGAEAVGLLRRFKRHDSRSLAELRRDFMGYTVETELPMEEAESWFKRILFYASRTLSRQYILADALIVHRMLRIKHRHRAAYFAALLNEHRAHGSRIAVYLGIVETEGLLLTPHVNHSGTEYLPENGLIRTPLTRIEGLGGEAAEAIVRAREDGEFADLEDFIRRVPPELVTNKDVELIAAAGAIGAGGGWGEPPTPTIAVPVPERQRPEVSEDGQLVIPLKGEKGSGGEQDGGASTKVPPIKKDGNIRAGFNVLENIAEFYPHPSGTRVELVGRVRDLHSFKTSSEHETCFFVLFDASASVPVFVPKERFGRAGEPPAEGDRVLVRGFVRTRDRRRVCDAVEVLAEGGAISHGETTTDEPPEGNP
jgi:DNA polymerase-3 subunit alpha